jgi:Fe-S-cluster-containing dehydrogenase component
MRYGMVIDLKRCIGCNSCTIACKQTNATPKNITWTRVILSEMGTYPNTRLTYLPVLCNHCAEAPCVDVCPTGASQKLADGTVWVDPDQCIGCRFCMTACPYNARFFNYGKPEPYNPEIGYTPYEEARLDEHPVGAVTKCDFCMDRVAEGLDPACVQTCPANARIFGDLDDPDSEVSRLLASRDSYQLYPELGTDPSVYYLPG